MAERGLLATLAAPFRRRSTTAPAAEGEPRPGPYYVHNPDGWLPDEWGQYWNYWQMGRDPIGGIGGAGGAVVEACVSAYAQTIAQCPGDHWRALPNGGRERVTTSALSRILRWPNDYQSRSDFILNLVRGLYLDGNAYSLATRNDRYEVSALHPFDPKMSKAVIAPNGEIFYDLAGNNILKPRDNRSTFGTVPARNVFHVKLEAAAGEPLKGIPPVRHAALAAAAQNAIGLQLLNVFANMNRPAGVIETEQNLTKPQIDELRARLKDSWRAVDNLNAGPPVLTNGFKFHGISMTAKDAELATVAKLTQDEIFMVYGVPPAILGMTDKGAFSSTEALMQFWLSRGLGFAINHIEVAFDQFFGLRGWPEEYVEFDTHALLRVAYKERIEGLARGVQTAIYTPNEARRAEDLPDKEGGNEPRVQQQQVPLDWGGFDLQPAAPQQPAAPAPPGDDEGDDGEGEDRDWKTLTFTAMTNDRAAA
jgi:HK97 family phage portal protein